MILPSELVGKDINSSTYEFVGEVLNNRQRNLESLEHLVDIKREKLERCHGLYFKDWSYFRRIED